MPDIHIPRPDQVWSYEDVANGAIETRRMLLDRGIKLHRDSALNILFKQAEKLSGDWGKDRSTQEFRTLIDASHANRIIQAIRTVGPDPAAQQCLERMAKKDMNLSLRARSQGKDALWEIELLSVLRHKGVSAEIVDPPDIVVKFAFGTYSIACKKIYNSLPRTVESQLRSAVKQIERSELPGLIAINIDDLVLPDVILRSRTYSEALSALEALNKSFIEKNRFLFQKFVRAERCDGIFVSVSVPSDIENSRPRFNNMVHMAIWTLNSISENAKLRLDYFRSAFRDILSFDERN